MGDHAEDSIDQGLNLYWDDDGYPSDGDWCRVGEFEGGTSKKPLKAGDPCPSCKSPLLLRVNCRTKQQFLGCSAFPRCKRTFPCSE